MQFIQNEIDILRTITSANKREVLCWLIQMEVYHDEDERDGIIALIGKLDLLQQMPTKEHNHGVIDFLKGINPDEPIEITNENRRKVGQ